MLLKILEYGVIGVVAIAIVCIAAIAGFIWLLNASGFDPD